MPRSRGSEMPQQRQSPRAPLHLKPTACSEANSIRSPKLEDRRSPRSPLHERKNGPRVADLETKLGQAQEELKKLKEQLAAAEAARIDAQKELEETKKHFPASPLNTAALDPEDEEKEKTINIEEDKVDDGEVLMEKDVPLPAEDTVNCRTTDVFEVAPASSEGEGNKLEEEEDAEEGTETKVVIEEENSNEEVGTVEEKEEDEEGESPAITELRAILADKEKQLVSVAEENHSLKKEAKDAKADSSAAREKTEEMASKLAEAEEELSESKMTVELLREKLESEETAKASMEAEMKRLRVQTEQWRKAAEAAASVLATGDGLVSDGELNGRRLGESGRSMEKHLRGYNVSVGGGGWSPIVAVGEGGDGNGGSKRRGGGGGIRVFGELWKKKSQLK